MDAVRVGDELINRMDASRELMCKKEHIGFAVYVKQTKDHGHFL